MKKYISIDIGGTAIKYGIVSEDAEVLLKKEMKTEAQKGGPAILDKVIGIVEALKEEADAGVCISTAGMVDIEKGEIFYSAPLIPNYIGTAFKKTVEERFGIPCEVENDVNCAGLAEYKAGAAAGSKAAVMLTIGTGIGGCILLNGEVFHGFSNSACEVGYMHMDDSDFQTLGAASILTKKVAAWKGEPAENWSGYRIFEEAKKGDKSCPELRKLHQQRLREDLERYATSKEELVQIISEELKLRIEGGELKETSGPRTEDMHSVRIIGINRRVIEWAKSVFMITAISQNGKLDTVSVLYMNYKMIEDVIVASGFRPTRQQLFRQYVNILVTSLMTFVASEVFRDMGSVAPFGSLADQSSDAASDIDVSDAAADGADVDVDLDDIGDTVSGDTGFLSILSNVKIPGVVIGSICDGIVNSLMTLRIGYVTRNYLIDGMNSLNGIKAKRKAKRAAVKEALKSLPKVVVVGTSFVGKGAMNIILNIIGGKKVKETNEANVAD